MNRILLITQSALLSGLTIAIVSLSLLLPWFYFLFPVLLPLIMGFTFYQLKGLGYFFYACTVTFISFLFLSAGFESILFYVIPSLFVGGALGIMLHLHFGLIDMIMLLTWFQMAVNYLSLVALNAIFDVDLITIIEAILPSLSLQILAFYLMSLLTSTLLVWMIVEDQHRFHIRFAITRLPAKQFRLMLGLGVIAMIIMSLFGFDGATLLFGPLLWIAIFMMSQTLSFKTSVLGFLFAYFLGSILLLIGLATAFPEFQSWIFIPVFFLPFMKVKTLNTD
jgi:hypothetical protein